MTELWGIAGCHDRRRGSAASAVALAAGMLLSIPAAAQDVLYEFFWEGGDGNALSATGMLVLDGGIAVGQSFDTEDVISFDVELFDGMTSVAMATLPPFDIGFDAVVGTRVASGLEIDDFLVTPGSVFFGCTASDCLSATVRFKTSSTGEVEIDYASIQAARDSFVFTELPEPEAGAGGLAVLAALGSLAGRRISDPGPLRRGGRSRSGIPRRSA